MTTDAQVRAFAENLAWLESQLSVLRQTQDGLSTLLEQTQRQVNQIAEQSDAAVKAVREIDPKIAPFLGLPDKVRGLSEDTEHLRQTATSHKAEIDNALRISAAESTQAREERREVVRRIETASTRADLAASEISQVKATVSQMSEALATIVERQREVEQKVEQFGLRMERAFEVNRDLEERIREVLVAEQQQRFEVVFERLQVVGEMVRRNEELIDEFAGEQTLREEVLQEIGVWRDQHARIDSRINDLEESVDRTAKEADRLHGAITLVEGRHAGLGERVATIRRDIGEVVDQVREEFAKYNKLMEKQRRKQIQALEQELRESKFHSFRPPEEP